MSKRKTNRILGHQPSRLRQAIHGLVLASALVASSTAMADNSDTKRNYHISSGSLSHALSEFAGSAGILLSVDARLTDGKTSKGLDGEYTVEEGFQKLLAGTGLVHSFTADKTVTLKMVENQTQDSVSTMPAVTVTGNAIYDATDPYNEDYRLPNAVTATKTDTPIMETPYSIKAVPKQVMEDQQVIRIEKALQNVAGVVQEASSSGLRDSFNIRGFSTGNDILYYRDGSPVPQNGGNAFSSKRDPANLERIEVLKGPGSLLFGRVEPGGIVNLVTKQPLATPYYSLQQQFGSFDYYRTSIDATGPLTKDGNLLYRFNGAYESAGSYSDFVNSDRIFVAPTLKWIIGPRTQFTAEMEYQRFDETPGALVTALSNGSSAYLPKFSRNLTAREPGWNSNKGDRILAGFNWSHGFNDNWTLSHRFYYTGINADIRDAFLMGLADTDGNVARGYEHQLATTDNYFTSMNITGKWDVLGLKNTLLLGGDYYRSDAKDPFDVRFMPGTFNLFNPVYNTVGFDNIDVNNRIAFGVDNTTSWHGLYFQDQIELPFNVFALGGFRYDQADQTDHLTSSKVGNENRVSPRGGILWRPIPELSFYGSYTENFGAQNGNNGAGGILPAQTAQQWELGTKTELLDGKFSATVAYFDLTKQNMATPDPNNTLFMRTIGEAESRGVELDISGELLPGWRVIGGYSQLLFANTTRDVGWDGSTGNQGKRMPNAPHNMGSLFSSYEFQSGDLKGFKFGGGITALSERQGNWNNDYQIPGYVLVNLMASYALKIGKAKLTTQLNIDNLTDKYYFAGSNTGTDVFIGAPRSFLGSVRIEY